MEAGLGLDFELGYRLPLPDEAYLEDRFLYDADALLGYVKANLPDGAEKGIAVTDADITRSESNYNYIFGLGSKPGSCCICSTDRLRWWSETDELYRLRLYKLLMHEAGHTYGLSHCKDKNCLMHYADSVAGLDDQDIYFCGNCARKIYGDIGTKSIVRRRAIKAFVRDYVLDDG